MTKHAKLKIVREELRIEVPDDNISDEELIDLIFTSYKDAISKLEIARQQEKPVVKAPTQLLERRRENIPGSKKTIILDILKAGTGQYSLKELIDVVDEKAGYAEQGRSSRTRVNRVIRELQEMGHVSYDGNGKLCYKEV